MSRKRPAAATKFIADAKAAGFVVRVTEDNAKRLAIYVERGTTNAGVEWAETTVYDSPLSHERLGFRTSNIGARTVFRFEGGMTHARGAFQYHRSLRQIRGTIGLTI